MTIYLTTICCCFLHGFQCSNKAADIVFALDTSSSIWLDDFQLQLSFVKSLLRHFEIGNDNIRVGVFTFGTKMYPEIYLNDYFTKDRLIQRVGGIQYQGGGTNTAEAMKYARELMFSEKHGARKGVDKVNVIVTDGLPSNIEDAILEASISRSVGIEIAVISIGLGTHLSHMKHIASDVHGGSNNKLEFSVKSFDQLVTTTGDVAWSICESLSDETRPVLSSTTDLPLKDDTGTKPGMNAVCKDQQSEVIFVVDSSSSIAAADYQIMLNFIMDVIGKFDVKPTGTRIGLVGYSDGIHPYIPLENTFNKQELKNRVLTIQQLHGGSKTGSVLQYLRKRGFAFARENVPRVVILLTDGQSSDADVTSEESQLLKDLGVHLFVLGIGKGVDEIELANIGSEPISEFVFQLDNFQTLQSITDVLVSKTCTVGGSNGGIRGDEARSPCQLDSPANLMFIYDHQSLSHVSTDVLQSTVNQLMIYVGSLGPSLKTGLISQRCKSNPQIPLQTFTNLEDIESQLSSSQEENLPHLVRDLRVRGYENSKTGQTKTTPNPKRIAVLFIEGPVARFQTLDREVKRLKYSRVEVFIVYAGKPMPQEVSQLASQPTHSHVVHVSEFTDASLLKSRVIHKLCRH